MKYITAINEVSRDIPPGIREKYGDAALFTAYGCVLLERETGRGYSYRALNLKTGRIATIHRRTNPLTTSGVGAIAEKIRLSPVAGKGTYEIDMPPGENLLRDGLTGILHHIFETILPEHGYGVREKQIELAAHILEAIGKRAISLSEAEVGTGKTHAYIIAAALAKRGRVNDFWLRGHYKGQSYAESAYMPVVISTSSIALQDAIVRDYIPGISRILMEHGVIKEPLTCVIRKGREHYICEKNLRAFYADTDRRTKRLIAPLLKEDASIDLADADSLTAYMKRKIGVSGRCDENCPHRDECRYLLHMEHVQSNKHDFQVCNHNYFLADVLRRAENGHPLIPHYQAVIIDEAHKFITAARQMYGVELSSLAVPGVVDSVLGFVYRKGESGEDARELALKLAGQNERLFQLLNDNIPTDSVDEETERYKTVMDRTASRYLRNISRLCEELSATLAAKPLLIKYKGRRAQVLRELTGIRERADELENYGEIVYWLERPEEKHLTEQVMPVETLLCAIPKHLSDMLYRDLWKKGIPVILTSGTLSAAGSFEHIKRKTGLDRVRLLMETSKPSPFNHRENALIYVSETMPFPDIKNRDYIMAAADETEKLIRAAHGHAALLFTSYKAMDMVYEILEGRGIGFPMFRMDKGGVSAIDRFRESKNGVLFASGAMWEGIDLPGDVLSMLMIVKLPFAVPDPIAEYERTLYNDTVEYINCVVVPEMIIKLKQGFGRLIRHENDTGVVALLDSRVRVNAPYRGRVLRALPDCAVTSDIADVEAFIQIKKGPDYFM